MHVSGQSDAVTDETSSATETLMQVIGVDIWRQDTVISATQEATTPLGVLGKPNVIDNKTLPSKVS